jgi:hypothetical protein
MVRRLRARPAGKAAERLLGQDSTSAISGGTVVAIARHKEPFLDMNMGSARTLRAGEAIPVDTIGVPQRQTPGRR